MKAAVQAAAVRFNPLATILVTASDTGVGKTRVAGWVARALSATGRTQVIKPVEAGAPSGHPQDAPAAAGDWAEAHTLISLPLPLAPLATGQGSITLSDCLKRLEALPKVQHRVIEGAGGVAVPIDTSGADWVDFAQAVVPDLIVIVIEDRLGAINQARLTHHYIRSRLPKVRLGIWLNAAQAVPEAAVARSNRLGIAAAGLTLIGESDYNAVQPVRMDLL